MLPLTECRIVDEGPAGAWRSLTSVRAVLAERIEKAGHAIPFRTEWRFRVSAERSIEDACRVAIELGLDSSVALNGEEFAVDAADWIVDPAISNSPLPPIRPGENLLEVQRLCAAAADVQAPWILGPFRLDGSDAAGWTLERDEQTLAIGEWAEAGMPFYAGRVMYRCDLQGYELFAPDRAILRLPEIMGTAAVRVNGELAGQLLWPPYDLDITKFWKAGKLELEIEVAGNLANLFEAARPPACRDGGVERERFGLGKPPEIVMMTPAKDVEIPD